MAQIAAFSIIKKKFPGGMLPEPPNFLLIYSALLVLTTAAPLQQESLEPFVYCSITSLNV